jgi:hypothetical protein
VSASVIILMALVNVAPVGYTHAHEAVACQEVCCAEHGRCDHGHSHGHQHGSAPLCHQHCKHTHSSQVSLRTPALLNPHFHKHWFWWGFEWVLPATPGEESGPTAEAPDAATLSAADIRVGQSATTIPLGSPFVVLAILDIGGVDRKPQVASQPQRARQSNLLCDAARHERTGVQLL